GNYFGLITLALLAYLVFREFQQWRTLPAPRRALFFAIFVVALTSMGAFSPVAPYSLLQQLPVFHQMRVPSRWLGWFSLGVILYLARLPRRPLIYLLLALSALDVAIVNYSVLNAPQTPYHPPPKRPD